MELCKNECNFFTYDDITKLCKICKRLIKYKKIQNIKKNKLIQINKTRCWKCNKKIGVTAIQCRCKYYYCGKHRYSNEHDCPINYKKINKEILLSNNIKCQASKLEKL